MCDQQQPLVFSSDRCLRVHHEPINRQCYQLAYGFVHTINKTIDVNNHPYVIILLFFSQFSKMVSKYLEWWMFDSYLHLPSTCFYPSFPAFLRCDQHQHSTTVNSWRIELYLCYDQTVINNSQHIYESLKNIINITWYPKCRWRSSFFLTLLVISTI